MKGGTSSSTEIDIISTFFLLSTVAVRFTSQGDIEVLRSLHTS